MTEESAKNRVSMGVKRFGLRVFCPRCSQRGRFFGQRDGVRLREVRCLNCSGKFRALRGADDKTRAGWPAGEVQHLFVGSLGFGVDEDNIERARLVWERAKRNGGVRIQYGPGVRPTE